MKFSRCVHVADFGNDLLMFFILFSTPFLLVFSLLFSFFMDAEYWTDVFMNYPEKIQFLFHE